MGTVTFYGTFIAANLNNMNSGDSTFKSTLVITENTTDVQNFQENNFSFSAFPNPSAGNLNVKITLQESSSVEMDLLDISGNKVISLFSKENMNGEARKSFDISAFPNGIYFLRLKVDTSHSIHKIIKI